MPNLIKMGGQTDSNEKVNDLIQELPLLQKKQTFQQSKTGNLTPVKTGGASDSQVQVETQDEVRILDTLESTRNKQLQKKTMTKKTSTKLQSKPVVGMYAHVVTDDTGNHHNNYTSTASNIIKVANNTSSLSKKIHSMRSPKVTLQTVDSKPQKPKLKNSLGRDQLQGSCCESSS